METESSLQNVALNKHWMMDDVQKVNYCIDKKVWIRIRKRCVDIERQNIEATMRERSVLTLCNSLMNNWEKEKYIELCTGEVRRRIIWWKIGVWRLKGSQQRRRLEPHNQMCKDEYLEGPDFGQEVRNIDALGGQ
jgi:hypothetical protein